MSRNQIAAISKALYKVAAEKYGIKAEPMAGLTAPSTYRPVISAIMSNILDIDAILERELELDGGNKNELNQDSGKVVQFADNGKSRKLLSSDDMRKVQVVISPGLNSGSTFKGMRGTYRQFKKIFPRANCAIYSPLDDGANSSRRYRNGMEYYKNEGVINNSESHNFLENIFLPRILDTDKSLLPPEQCGKMVLANFSIGCREARSHLRYFANYLRHQDKEEDEVRKYLDLVSVLNIASPVNWSGGSFDFATSVNLVSLTDMGNKKPVDFFKTIYCNEKLFEQSLSRFFRLSSPEFLLVTGPNVIPNGEANEAGSFVPNPSGHGLYHYVEGIRRNQELSRIVGRFNDFLDPEIKGETSSKELKEALRKDFSKSNSQKYLDANLEVSEKSLEVLIEALHTYVLQEEDALKKAKKSSFKSEEAANSCLEYKIHRDVPPSSLTQGLSSVTPVVSNSIENFRND